MKDIQGLQKQLPLQYGENNPILREKSLPVTHFSDKVKLLEKALNTLMREYEGVGLAAPQIGHNVRMIAITQRDTKPKKRKLLEERVMINPVIIGTSQETNIDEEACLSLPNITGKVKRVSAITVKFQTIDGKSHILKAEGYNARIILHEIDHLDGILFIDKLV